MRLFLIIFGALLLAGGPADADVTAANFADAARYSASHGGMTLRVEKNGRLLFENYSRGWSSSTSHKIYSGTKSFVAVAALIAQQQGLLSFDEKASDTLTEWRHDGRRAITINQLLSHTSGLDADGSRIYPYADQMAAAVHVPLIATPGAQFHYGAVNYEAFGELLRRKLHGKSVESFIKDKVIDPLDIDIDGWVRDRAGNVLTHSGLILDSQQWAKFGRYVNGLYNSRPESHILFTGHEANPAYGLGFWINRPPPEPRSQSIKLLQLAIDGDQLYPDGARDLIACIGSEKQRLYMIPSQDLVIVRFGYEHAFSDGDFLSRLLTGKAHPDAHTH